MNRVCNMLKTTIKFALNILIVLVVSLAFLPVQGGNSSSKRKIPKDEHDGNPLRHTFKPMVEEQTRAVTTKKDENFPCHFMDLPQGVPQIIFTFLTEDANKNARRVCKNWKLTSDGVSLS
ncbi:MAG: hypothetical protein K2P93_01605 [Alphaproteobacteria bacterium]|nr:hypothetical protein [Alphaproteobacteria bacterium]